MVAEYRHTLFDGTDIPIPFYSWFDRFQGVLFAGGGTTSFPEGYDGLFSQDRIFTEVGYGLRAHILAYGAQSYLIAVDVAFPLTPTTRQKQTLSDQGSPTLEDRAPFKLILGVSQTF
jgi:hypothetical protein